MQTVYAASLVAACFLICAVFHTATAAGMGTFMVLVVALLIPGWALFIPKVGYTGFRLFMLRLVYDEIVFLRIY